MLKKARLIMNLVMLLTVVSLTTFMYVFAARGVGALSEYTISFISPYCFLIDGDELNLAMKKQATSNTSSYTQTDNKIKQIIFDSWDDSTYGTMFNWDTSSSANVDATANANIRLFYNNSSKTVYVLSKSLIASRDCAHMFENFTALESVDFRNFNSIESTSHENMFSGDTKLAQILNSDNISTNLSTSMQSMFYNCEALTSIDTTLYKTPNVTTMNSMFKNCINLTSLNINSFEGNSVTNLAEMFSGCSDLTSLTMNSFKTPVATTMQDMFKNCSSLTTIAPTSLDTTLVTNLSGMFSGCSSLSSLDLSSFVTTNTTDFSQMFYGCSSLTNLDLKNITTDKATTFAQMFANCGATTLDLSKFDTQNVLNMNQMFYSMSNLTTISVSNLWVATQVTNSTDMFTNSTNLVGGWGTEYDSTKIDKTYAHVDLPDTKGYLTACDVQYKGVYVYDEFNTLLNITYVGTETPYTLPDGEEYDYYKDSQNNTYQPNDTLPYELFNGVENVNLTMYVKRYAVTFANGDNGNYVSRTVTYTYKGQTNNVSSGTTIPKGSTVDITVSLNTSSSNYSNPRCTVARTSGGASVSMSTVTQYSKYQFTMPDAAVTITFTCSYSGGGFCVASGTKVMLADGTEKNVEDITLNDKLLIINHETGQFDVEEINFIEHDGIREYPVVNLVFSNGKTSRMIYEHGYFDLDLNKYVYIHEEDCQDFIGHRFFAIKSTNPAESEIVTLQDAFVTHETTDCYSLVTKYHLNYFIDSVLSMPGGISGLFNIFEYGENLKYDETDKQTYIDLCGLFDYADFEGLLTPEEFDLYPTKYLKVALYKGIITPEMMEYLIERYT